MRILSGAVLLSVFLALSASAVLAEGVEDRLAELRALAPTLTGDERAEADAEILFLVGLTRARPFPMDRPISASRPGSELNRLLGKDMETGEVTVREGQTGGAAKTRVHLPFPGCRNRNPAPRVPTARSLGKETPDATARNRTSCCRPTRIPGGRHTS